MKINEKEYLVEAKYVDGEKYDASGKWIITINSTNLFPPHLRYNAPFNTKKVYYRPHYIVGKYRIDISLVPYLEGQDKYGWISCWREKFDWLIDKVQKGLTELNKEKILDKIYDVVNKEDFVTYLTLDEYTQ